MAGFVADIKSQAIDTGFHVHDERHFVETYSLRQLWEVDLHPEEACSGPIDLHLSLDVDPRAEALIYAAARAQLVAERLGPLLAQGRWVILDRFVDSSLAYQGAGRGLGIENVAAINEMATPGIRPDRTLYLWLDPQVRAGRLDGRGEGADRLEASGEAFFAAVDGGYRELAAAEPARIRTLDAALAPDELVGQAIAAVEDLLP